MDQELEKQLLERVQRLEAQVARLAGLDDAPVIEDPHAKMASIVECIYTPSLGTILREMPRDEWAVAFIGQPRKSIEKLKAAVSKNSWAEIVEAWRTCRFLNYGKGGHQLEFIKLVRHLEDRGVIVLAPPEGIELTNIYPPSGSPFTGNFQADATFACGNLV